MEQILPVEGETSDTPRSGNAMRGVKYLILQLALALLTIATLAILLAEEAVSLPTEVHRIVQGFDLLVCGIFFFDFCVRFAVAPSKREFMRWGWIDLIACIPNVDALRAGRLVRVLRIIRLIRGLRATHRLFKIFLQHRAHNTLIMVFVTLLLVATFASVAILMVEDGEAEANIHTAGDAIWWSLTTITTVGYGDRFPVTVEGRLVAIVLMFCGVGFFGTLSGLIATWMLGGNTEETTAVDKLTQEIEALRGEVRTLTSGQTERIQRLLDRLEHDRAILRASGAGEVTNPSSALR